MAGPVHERLVQAWGITGSSSGPAPAGFAGLRGPLMANVRPHISPSAPSLSSSIPGAIMSVRTGGCLCGTIRYRTTSDPVGTRVCWCHDCQHLAANGSVNAVFPTSAVEISGSPAEYVRTADSGNQVRRRFCSACGSHLFAETTARPGYIVVRVGTLDDPSSVKPSANIWSSSAPAWACLDPALQRVERQPPPPAPTSVA